MSDADRYGRFTVDNSRLLLWCMDWFRIECVRIQEVNENLRINAEQLGVFYRPLRFVWDPIIRILTFPHKYDPDEIDQLFAQGIQALKDGDQTTALSTVMTIEEKIASTKFGLQSYKEYLNRYHYILIIGTAKRQRNALINLWFDIAHEWRPTWHKGLYQHLDLNKFRIPHALLCFVSLIAGVGIPIAHSSGWYQLIPPTYLAMMCAWMYFTGRYLTGFPRILMQISGGMLSLHPLSYVRVVMSDWVLCSWLGGIIIGTILANHAAYQRCQYQANKYGPFGCLWARHIRKNTYELLMVDSDGNKVWHYQVTGWSKHVDPTLGSGMSPNFCGACRRKGWVLCYPALISPRVQGISLREPIDWNEARGYTPGIDDTLVDEFFTNTLSSPIAPPPHMLAGGPQSPRSASPVS